MTAAVVAMVLLAARPSVDAVRVERAHYVMGTIFEITAYGPARESTASAIQEAFAAIRRSDERLSHFRDDSELTRMNRLAGGRDPIAVGPELCAVLGAARRWSRASGGAFDVTVAPLVRLWQSAAEVGVLPRDTDLERTRSRVGWDRIELLPDCRVRLGDGTAVSLGAIGKGWALDRGRAVLKAHGIERAFLSAGTSTVYAMGAGPSGRGWAVAVRDPRDPDGVIETVELRDQALSTSASDELYFEVEGERLSHILDPRTGRPVDSRMLSASVLAPSGTEADALSTAVYVLGAEGGAHLLERLGRGGILVALDGAGNAFVNRLEGKASWDGNERP